MGTSPRALSSLISMNQTVTPAMLANNNYPSDSEVELLKNYFPAFQSCQSYTNQYIRTYVPWNMTISAETAQRDMQVLADLTAKKITFAEANRKFIDISAEFVAEAKANTERERAARSRGAATLSPEQQAAAAEVKHACNDALAPYAGGMLDGKIPMRAGSPLPA